VAKRLLREAQLKPVYTRDGGYVGTFPSIPLGEDRVRAIFLPIVQGLYFDETKRRMPDDLVIKVSAYPPWQFQNVVEALDAMGAPPQRALGDVFSFTYRAVEEPRFASYWLLHFYGKVMFTVWASEPVGG
jgi:hypothetical protein